MCHTLDLCGVQAQGGTETPDATGNVDMYCVQHLLHSQCALQQIQQLFSSALACNRHE